MKQNILTRLSFILTSNDLKRIRIEEKKNNTKVLADVHGMKVQEAKRFINNIINVIRTKIELVIIHGYHHGDAIKDMLATRFSNYHIKDQYQDVRNMGVTHMIIEE